jgi:hypothetical protein
MNFVSLVKDVLAEKFNPYNLNQSNPFEGVDLTEVCYFDTETTGLDPRVDQIVELAAKMGDQEHYAKMHLTPEVLDQIKKQQQDTEPRSSKSIEELLTMSGYREGDKPTVTEEQALKDFEQFIGPAKILVAHNAGFDMKMVNRRRRLYGLAPMEKKKVWDTRPLSSKFMIPTLLAIEQGEYSPDDKEEAKRMLDILTTKFNKSGSRGKISSRLGDISKAIFGDIKGWHQAMADVTTMKGIVEKFLIQFFQKHYGSEVTTTKAFQKHYGQERKRERFFR